MSRGILAAAAACAVLAAPATIGSAVAFADDGGDGDDPTISASSEVTRRGGGAPVLLARALYPALKLQPGPASGTVGVAPANGVTPPFAGQPIPGISGALSDGRGGFWGQPDNGFGSKGNSADFLLRMYHFTPRWRSLFGGRGELGVDRFISYRDPDRKIPFAIVNESTPDRLLTGADFDIESVQRGTDGTLWIGEEFGPFLLHTDATGKVLDAPVPLPGVKSPQSPYLAAGETPNLPGSRGFEAMARSADGRTLYPTLEAAVTDDPDPTLRRVYEFDVASNAYTGRRWTFHADAPGLQIGDAQVLRGHRLVFIERDDLEGTAAQVKKLQSIDLDAVPAADATLPKTQLVDFLHLRDPLRISVATGPQGGVGIGDPFSFPIQSFETVVLLGADRILIANDNNLPDSDGRVPGKPDDLEAEVLWVPGLN
jgi:glycerophosphoryl diester phosphodiesterase